MVKQIAHFYFPLKSVLFFFLETCCMCVFYIFTINMYVFVVCKNYFLFFTRFKKVDLLKSQSIHVDLFVLSYFLMLLLLCFYYLFSFHKLSSKCFFSFLHIVFLFKTIFIILNHHTTKVGSIFLTIHFKHFDLSI